MTFDITAVMVAFITVVGGGGLIGWAALRKSGKEADKYNAEAASTLVSSASDVVGMLHEQMVEQQKRQEITDARVEALEHTVIAWDGWADKVLEILDRALGMLTKEQKADLLPDVKQVQESRPPQMHRHYHDKNIVHRPHDDRRS
jgi:hypothetical protein